MDAEKNVVEAARKLLKLIQPNAVGGFDVTGNLHDELRELMGAIAAYDSAPAPSEDRVREAAGRCVRALLMDSRCTEGDRLAIKKRGSDGNEHDLGAWSHDAALNVIAEALRPYVTPAPALPAGTVVARLEWLRLMLTVAKQRDCTEIVDEIEGFLAKLPRPEPPKELVRKWELEAEKWAASRFLENPLSARIGYVAALRAAWEADPKGKQ
jgi:hypothetical protein